MKLRSRLIVMLRNPQYNQLAAKLAMGPVPEKWLYLGPGCIIDRDPEDIYNLVRTGQFDPVCEGAKLLCKVNATTTGIDGVERPLPDSLTPKRIAGLEERYRLTAIAQLYGDQTKNTPNQVFEHYKQRLEEAGISTEGLDKYDLLMTFQAMKNGQRVIPAEEWNQAAATGDD